MEIPIPGKDGLYIEKGPRFSCVALTVLADGPTTLGARASAGTLITTWTHEQRFLCFRWILYVLKFAITHHFYSSDIDLVVPKVAKSKLKVAKSKLKVAKSKLISIYYNMDPTLIAILCLQSEDISITNPFTSQWCHMSIRASQITNNLTVYWTVCQGQHHKIYHSSASLSLCEGNLPVTSGFPSQMASNVLSLKRLHVMMSSWNCMDAHFKKGECVVSRQVVFHDRENIILQALQ